MLGGADGDGVSAGTLSDGIGCRPAGRRPVGALRVRAACWRHAGCVHELCVCTSCVLAAWGACASFVECAFSCVLMRDWYGYRMTLECAN